MQVCACTGYVCTKSFILFLNCLLATSTWLYSQKWKYSISQTKLISFSLTLLLLLPSPPRPGASPRLSTGDLCWRPLDSTSTELLTAVPVGPVPLLCFRLHLHYLDFRSQCLVGTLSSCSIPLSVHSSWEHLLCQKHGSHSIVLFLQTLHWPPVIVIYSSGVNWATAKCSISGGYSRVNKAATEPCPRVTTKTYALQPSVQNHLQFGWTHLSGLCHLSADLQVYLCLLSCCQNWVSFVSFLCD